MVAGRTIRVQAAVEHRHLPGPLFVSVTESGKTAQYALVDDGSVAGDVPMDGLWTAVCPIGSSRFVNVELGVMGEVASQSLYDRLIPVPAAGDASLNFYLETSNDGLVAHRVAWLPASGSDEYFGSCATLALAFGWGLLVLVYVGFLVVLGRKR